MNKKNKDKLIDDSSKIDITSKGDVARQQLILSAMALFAENGFEGTSTREISNQAQQNIGAIAYYFGSKEGLYRAVLEFITDYINAQFLDKFLDIDDFFTASRYKEEPEQCLDYLKQIISHFLILLTRPETMHFSQIMIREQMAPTAAYHIIHERALSSMQSNVTKLISGYCGLDEHATETILHTHSLLGSIVIFRAGYKSLMMRTGWETIDEQAFQQIEQTVFEHVDYILTGLRQRIKNQVVNDVLN